MRREEVLLTESINRTIEEAHEAKIKFHEMQERQSLASIEDPDDHEFDDADEYLAYLIEKIYRDTSILAERLNLQQFAEMVNRERETASKNFTQNEDTHHDVLPHFPHLVRARNLFYSISSMTDVAATTAQGVLEAMLKNTGRLITQRKINPKSEADVRNAMLEAIRLGFEDARKEIPIPKGFKVYRADIGIPSIRVAIEYKYIKTRDEMKSCLDGIYADMKGYGSDDAWRTFYAVFYMTGPFYRQDEVEKEFSLVRADINWTPIVVVGPGGGE